MKRQREHRTGALALVFTLALLCPQAGRADDSILNAFTDPEDGEIDASDWLLEKKGFLPVPIIITEPAVGYGAGVGLVFFRQSIAEAAQRAKETGHVTPPDVFGVLLAGTENGTRIYGGGGMFTFADDRWRYRGGVGNADVNLDFYGGGDALGTGDLKLGYNLDGWVSSQQALLRLGESNHFLAARWIYLNLDTSFDLPPVLPEVQDNERGVISSGLGLSWEYDTRDNIFTPSRGLVAALDTMFYRPDFGSDTAFEAYRAHIFSYTPFAQSFVLGLRLDARTARGDVPFYQLPYIDLRGIAAARYQDENVGAAEAELRWNATPRWALIGFLGAGRAWGGDTDFSDASTEDTQGFGFRYLIARKLGVYMGVDFAWGPDDQDAFYIQVGSAWR